ncbi:type II toxin-antitoxin system PemK/MazF family toxin [Candidatus Woesearchaeota archaeon]|nr:type II toxin-antitoxin system PemK/MazF family toxin [Candidatus Woesearchaeota archaeon]
MRQQDIIWVRLPFSSLEGSKVRPAVIVSNNDYNGIRPDVIVCAITSKLEDTRYSIVIDNKNISQGKLPLKSRIRADKIMQIEKNLIIKSFARLDNKTFDLLTKEIINLIQRTK